VLIDLSKSDVLKSHSNLVITPEKLAAVYDTKRC